MIPFLSARLRGTSLIQGLKSELFSFALIGIVASIMHFVIAVVLIEVFSFEAWLANAIAVICAAPVSYFGHACLTFTAKRSGRKDVVSTTSFRRFVTLAFVGLTLNQTLFVALNSLLKVPHREALTATIVTVAGVSFLISKLWVFRGDK